MANIEEPKDPKMGFNVSQCGSHRASCCEKPAEEAPKKDLDSNKLGGTGIASKRRSTVTKSVLRASQGGFDDLDPSKNVSSAVKISSARPSMVASLVSTIVGENKEAEEVKYFWFIPLTNNVKALFVMMVRSCFCYRVWFYTLLRNATNIDSRLLRF